MAHTPGPWRVDDGDSTLRVRSTDTFVCVALVTGGVDSEDNDLPNGPTYQANARLIAAAPELLDALEDFVTWHGGAHSEECPGDDTCDCVGGAVNAKVNAAIRKAREEPPPTNAVDPHAQPSGTPTPREKGIS